MLTKKVVVLQLIRKGCRKAEIRPNEPDSGNADVGRVSDFIRFIPSFDFKFNHLKLLEL
jgi:hypothetical protein